MENIDNTGDNLLSGYISVVPYSSKEKKVDEVAAFIRNNRLTVDDAIRKAAIDKHEFYSYIRESKELKKIVDDAIRDNVTDVIEYNIPTLVLQRIIDLLSGKMEEAVKETYDADGNLLRREIMRKPKDISPVLLLELAQLFHPQFNPDSVNMTDISRQLKEGILRVPEGPGIGDEDMEIMDVDSEEVDSN